VGAPGGPGDPAGPGSGGPGGQEIDVAPVGGTRDSVDVGLGTDLLGFDALVEYAVPSLVLTVPGLLLMLAVLGQALVGAAWLPVVRRWLGGFGFARRRHDADPPRAGA
jgi:hypothetical protein